MEAATSHEPARGTTSTSVRRAGAADVAAITRLVNECYLIEQFFVDGDRTDEAEISGMMDGGHFLVLERFTRSPDGSRIGAGGLAGAVFVRIAGERGYFGMLSVAPDLRSFGIGRRLVGVAEALCAAQGCTVMDLQIVNLREELGPWYKSQGYQEVGTAPFTSRELKRPCHFVKMSKALSSSG